MCGRGKDICACEKTFVFLFVCFLFVFVCVFRVCVFLFVCVCVCVYGGLCVCMWDVEVMCMKRLMRISRRFALRLATDRGMRAALPPPTTPKTSLCVTSPPSKSCHPVEKKIF